MALIGKYCQLAILRGFVLYAISEIQRPCQAPFLHPCSHLTGKKALLFDAVRPTSVGLNLEVLLGVIYRSRMLLLRFVGVFIGVKI